MFGLGFGELLVIFVIVLVLFGPAKLPQMARALGRALREFKKVSSDFSSYSDKELNHFQEDKENKLSSDQKEST